MFLDGVEWDSFDTFQECDKCIEKQVKQGKDVKRFNVKGQVIHSVQIKFNKKNFGVLDGLKERVMKSFGLTHSDVNEQSSLGHDDQYSEYRNESVVLSFRYRDVDNTFGIDLSTSVDQESMDISEIYSYLLSCGRLCF